MAHIFVCMVQEFCSVLEHLAENAPHHLLGTVTTDPQVHSAGLHYDWGIF
jgi:hypothetical protein